MVRIPSLDALRIFVIAARHQSFTEAANELNITQSAVSHRIRGLEEELGVALFKRLTRRLELTQHGRGLAQKLSSSISEIDRSIRELVDADDARPVKVTTLPSVASRWLIPRLPNIRKHYPDVEVQVIADPRLLDLRNEGIDLAIRFGRTPNPGYAVTRLMSDCVVPVCAPGLLRQYKAVTDIDSLLALPLLHDLATIHDWKAWLGHFGRSDIACHSGQHFSEAGMMIEAAEHGLGVALARASLIADQIARSTLVCPLRLAAPTSFSYYLLELPEAVDRPRVVAFRDLLIADAAMTERFMRSLSDPATSPANDSFAFAAEA